MTKRERARRAKHLHMTIKCLEDMAAGRTIPEVVGSIKILSELIGGGYAITVREYSDGRYSYRDVGITDAGRVRLVELQNQPKDYVVGPHDGIKLLEG